MKMWVKWECFSVKGTDRFLVGNGVRRWELLLMAELSASKRKKSESETVKERESEKMGWLWKQAILENFQWRSFFLLSLLLLLNRFAFSLLWLLREDAMNWYCCICETVSVYLVTCEGNTVRNYFLFVGFIFINFIGFFFFFFPCGFLVVFGFFIGKRFGCKRLSEPEVCGAMSSGSGGGGQDTQDGDHVTLIHFKCHWPVMGWHVSRNVGRLWGGASYLVFHENWHY